MNKVTLLIGLPGCGKTTLGKKLEEAGACFIDDVSFVGRHILQEKLEQGVICIVASDPFLCRKNDRINAIKFIESYGYAVECVFFENNLDKCLANVRKRNDGREVEGLTKVLHKEYDIPELAEIREVYHASYGNYQRRH